MKFITAEGRTILETGTGTIFKFITAEGRTIRLEKKITAEGRTILLELLEKEIDVIAKKTKDIDRNG